MRWVKATLPDGERVWINMATVFTISQYKEKDTGRVLTEVIGTEKYRVIVVESPEHLVEPFR